MTLSLTWFGSEFRAFAQAPQPRGRQNSRNKKPRASADGGVFRTTCKPYGAYVSSSSVGTLKSRDIMTLNAVMVKIENTNSLRAQTVSSTAL